MINTKKLSPRDSASNSRETKKGFTLVEAMLASAIVCVIAIGSLCYQYLSIRHTRASQAQVMATHLAQLLLEDWKSTNADTTYDPTTLGLGFLTPQAGDGGQYIITVDNQTFYLWKTVSNAPVTPNPDTVANVTLRKINITVQWRSDFGRGGLSADDPMISLTTYVRCDGT
jgi:prepilin-type N-terminal cleavage/methylation domain-containing protein